MANKRTETTNDYSKFSFLMENRQTARNHINRLKKAITKNPEILEVQPILVNEKLEIIDGQHRFVAASELGIPVHYTIVPGLDISTARDMNVMQRRWHMDDYAYSYAKAGNVNYKAFNKYRRENPGIPSSILLLVLAGKINSKTGSLSADFRSGEFVINREQEDVEWILEKLSEIKTITMGEIPFSRGFVTAFMVAIENEDFEYEGFISNLRSKPDMFHRVSVVRDGLRMIEDIYNYRKSTNLIRLY